MALYHSQKMMNVFFRSAERPIQHHFELSKYTRRPPLWSSGQFLTTDPGVPGSIPGHYKKKSSGSGTGSIQPREYN
jgi:hypothetical protein